MKRPNNIKEQTTQRQELRNKGTAAEATLWHGLKGRQIEGMRWRRQFGVGPYILDFYCPQLHLCIELDGAHTTRYKAKRMTYNAKNGYCKYMGYALYALKIKIFSTITMA